jgi:hypothetical protein
MHIFKEVRAKALNPIFCVVVAAFLSAYTIEARAQLDCRCSGTLEDHFSDGDSKLQWTFDTYLVAKHSTHPRPCGRI